jgi:hypothetical protein
MRRADGGLAIARWWGDGGHHGVVWWESPYWRCALVHVPTGEILYHGCAPTRWRALEYLRKSARRRGLADAPRLRLYRSANQ